MHSTAQAAGSAASIVPPQASAATQNPAWPNDPDVGRLKKLKAEAKAPARQVNEATANPHISQQELERGRIAASDPTSPQQNACDYSNAPECLYTPWAILKKVGSNGRAGRDLCAVRE